MALGQRLAAHLPAYDLPYVLTPVEESLGGPSHEPMACPGGYLFVPAKLLQTAQDESEFAGLLAHSLAHIAERQWVRPVTKATIPLFVGVWHSANGDPRLFPVALRQMELEADAAAARAMSQIGYDPAALVRYIDRLQPQDGTRAGALQIVIRTLPERQYLSQNQEWARIQFIVNAAIQPAEPHKPMTPPTLMRKP